VVEDTLSNRRANAKESSPGSIFLNLFIKFCSYNMTVLALTPGLVAIFAAPGPEGPGAIFAPQALLEPQD
jgi:hypothetical protein